LTTRSAPLNPPRAELRRISARFSNLDSAVMCLRRADLLTEGQARRLHARITARWHAENLKAIKAARS